MQSITGRKEATEEQKQKMTMLRQKVWSGAQWTDDLSLGTIGALIHRRSNANLHTHILTKNNPSKGTMQKQPNIQAPISFVY